MGATNFEYKLSKKKFPTEDSVYQWYKDECNKQMEYYGHQEGYNGTIATTRGITFENLPFEEKLTSEGAAFETMLGRSEKWGKARAAQFVSKKGEIYWLITGWAAE